MKFSIFFDKIFKIVFYVQILINDSVIGLSKDKFARKLLRLGAYVCFACTTLLIIWAFVSESNYLAEKYEEYIVWLADLELHIAAVDNRWLLILVVLLLYFVKTAFPLYPISLICVATAMVFDIYSALAINCAGLALLFAVKYVIGTNMGGGNMQKLIRKSRIVKNLIESEGTGNPWVLFVLRLVPSMPTNSISQLYGAMEFPFLKYLLISLVGYCPKLISYIIIGRNVFNPFSLRFSIPLTVMTFVTGVTLMTMSIMWDAIDKYKVKSKV